MGIKTYTWMRDPTEALTSEELGIDRDCGGRERDVGLVGVNSAGVHGSKVEAVAAGDRSPLINVYGGTPALLGTTEAAKRIALSEGGSRSSAPCSSKGDQSTTSLDLASSTDSSVSKTVNNVGTAC